jgi:hypothetical protein
MQDRLNEQLDLFFGEATAGSARVYAQLPADDTTAGLQLCGWIYGPECAYARTLPTRFSLVDAGPGSTLLAQAMISEPCFWSADMPYLYAATIELRRGDEVVAHVERTLGIRLLLARGAELQWEREPYALKGIYRDKVSAVELTELHDRLAVLTRQPSDEVLREASRCGVLLLALVDGSPEQVLTQLRQLSQWPAVGIVVVERDVPATTSLRPAARNMLLAQVLSADELNTPAAWADVLIIKEGVAESGLPSKMTTTKPVLRWSGSRIESA